MDYLHTIEGLKKLLFMKNFEITIKDVLILLFSGKNQNKCLP